MQIKLWLWQHFAASTLFILTINVWGESWGMYRILSRRYIFVINAGGSTTFNDTEMVNYSPLCRTTAQLQK